MEKDDLSADAGEMMRQACMVGNINRTNELENKREILESEFAGASDPKVKDSVQWEENRLAEDIKGETEFEKKWR